MVERYDNSIAAHASSHRLTNYVNARASRRSTKANDKANGKLLETSLHRHNNHQGTWRKVEEAMVTDKVISSQTDTNLDEAKTSHLANISRRRVHFKRTALSVAK